jgi:hypothetical protein
MLRLRHRGPSTRFTSLLVIALAVPGAALAGSAGDIAGDAQPLATVDRLTMPAVDHGAALAADAAAAGPGVPVRFAIPQAVRITPLSHGTWETLDDGDRLWRLQVRSAGAVSLNFGFTTYSMPLGGSLVIYTPDASAVLGPWDNRHNKAHRQLWTPVLPGDEAVIEVRVPAQRVDRLGLELTAINHGYREFGKPENPDKSGACNIDVVCPESAGWDSQIRSVAALSRSGFFFCSGFLVNNTAEDFTPYFMTAAHCTVTAGNAPSLVVYWNYFNSACRPPGSPSSGGLGDGSLSQNQSGATFLASSPVSDYTLVELDEIPDPSANVFYAGWDARDADFSSAVAIHHPQVQEKRISFEHDPTTTTSYRCPNPPGISGCFGPLDDGTHIRVADWDEGTTEGGSSGSPLFNPNGLVIGQLHGGYAACGNDLPDWYGRISASWDLGLKEWLDPGDSGTLVQQGLESVCTDPCCPDATTLCLNNRRFQVQVDWKNFEEEEGVGSRVQFGADDSGLLWFFDPANWEMLVKVLNGCGTNGHYWVFTAATTNVEYTITVTDTENGEIWTRTNPLGTAAPAVTDIEAFATCP